MLASAEEQSESAICLHILKHSILKRKNTKSSDQQFNVVNYRYAQGFDRKHENNEESFKRRNLTRLKNTSRVKNSLLETNSR